MKKITLLLAMFIASLGFAQVPIGNGTNESQNAPFEPFYGYTYSQTIYLASEINANGNITGLQWYYSGTTALPNSQDLTIYLGHTTKTSFAGSSDWEPVSGLTAVYTGGIPVNGPGWVTITFTTPFAYNGTDNLLIAVDENMASYDGSSDDFYNTAVSAPRTIYFYNDSTNPDPAAPPTSGFTLGTASFIPNIILNGIAPACVTPNNFVAGPILANTATLTWNDPSGSQTDYEYVIQPVGTGVPTTNGIVVLGSTTVIDNTVQPNTNYEAYVRANCGANGYSTWNGPITFLTPCVTYTAPWTYDVETAATTTNSNILDCWTSNPVNTTNSFRWDIDGNGSTPSSPTGPSGAQSGVKYFYTEASSGSQGAVAELYSPMVDISALMVPSLQFYYHMFGATIGELHVDVYNGTAWVNDVDVIIGQQQTAEADPWALKVVNLAAYTGTIQVRFRAIRGADYTGDISLDDISIVEAPACLPPNNIVVSNITTQSVQLDWDDMSNVSQFDFEYVIQAQGLGEPTTNGVSASDYSVTDNTLTSNTYYEVYVRADCGTNYSSWVGPINFKTLCDPFTVPYTENFDAYSGGSTTNPNTPDCWFNIDSGAGYNYVYSFSSNSAPNSFYLYNSSDNAGDYMLVSPETIALSSGLNRVRFFARGGAAGYLLEVGTLTNSSDPTTFTLISTINLTANYTQYAVSIPTGTDLHVAFRHGLGGTYRSVYLDDVIVEPIPTTPPSCVTNVVATPDASCGNYATIITWDHAASADGYKITIGTTTGGNDILDDVDLGYVATYSYVGMFNSTFYYTIVAYNANGDATSCVESSFTTNVNGCYCSSVPSSYDGNGITNVLVGTTNTAVPPQSYYDNSAATAIDMNQGISNTVQISFATGYTYDTHIWIDFNDDYNFDSSELVYSGVSTNANPTILDASFVMPATATVGQHRMRIGSADSGQFTPNPCYSGAWGVTVDLKVNIIVPSCSPAAVASTTVVPDCTNNNYTISVDVTALGNGTPAISDGTTTWPVSATGVVTVGPFTFGTNVTLTLLHGSDTACDLPLGTFAYATCPPSNDDCSGATVLTVGGDFAANSIVGTLVGATDSSTANPTCAFYQGNDVWYAITVPASGSITLETDSNNTSISDMGMAVYSGVCGSLVMIECDDDDGNGNFSMISLTGRTPGEVLHLRVWEYGGDIEDSYLVSAYDASILSSNAFELDNFKAYPNPVKDVLNLSYNTEISNVQVVNVLGQVVINTSMNTTNAQIDMSQLNAGTYIVNMTIEGSVKTIKVIKH
jgi:hypothetical protein